jgi:AraC-like DNA-binding protein
MIRRYPVNSNPRRGTSLGAGRHRDHPSSFFPWQQKRIAEFIDEHLAEDIPLAALAGIARLSLFHFARAFKHRSACRRTAITWRGASLGKIAAR